MWILQIWLVPDIFICNGWQSALIPSYYKNEYEGINDFYKKEFPKSLGVEDFNQWYKPLFDKSESSIYDQLHTSGTHLCRTIKNVFKFNSDDSLLITGGGAHNKFWIKKLKELKIKTVVPETKLIDFKEALIFSLLGVLKLRGEINILASVTGSSKDLSAGIIYNPWYLFKKSYND